MRNLRPGDWVLAQPGLLSKFGIDVGGREGIVDYWSFYPEYEDEVLVAFRGIDGKKIVKDRYLTRIPKHRAEGEAN